MIFFLSFNAHSIGFSVFPSVVSSFVSHLSSSAALNCLSKSFQSMGGCKAS